MTCSADFRRRVSEIKKQDNLSIEETETAVRFGVGQAGVFRWTKRAEPCRTRNKPSVEIDRDRLRLVRDAEEHPDAYQHERAERPGCSRRGISDALKRLKISRKKNSSPSESGRNRTKCFQQRNQGVSGG